MKLLRDQSGLKLPGSGGEAKVSPPDITHAASERSFGIEEWLAVHCAL